MWTGVGALLCYLAWHWLAALDSKRIILFGALGLFFAFVIHYFGFSKIAKKNIDRLFQFPEKICFFAFQAWKSYLIIAIMVAMGAFLRHSSIPKQYLAVIYSAIGGALILSSFHYYAHLLKIPRHE
jgi:membrane-anchored protein YejM (alkaline phosphatase superfamily)